ncbi:MAG: AI-2E family transporter [Acidobacteriota bacterium]
MTISKNPVGVGWNMNPLESRDQGARFLLVVASFVVVIAGIRAAASLMIPFMISLFIALVSFPMLNWLQSKKIPTPLAVLTTLLSVLFVLLLILFLVAGSINGFIAQVPKYNAQLELKSKAALEWLQEKGVTVPEQFTAQLIDPGRALTLASRTLTAVTTVLSNLLLVFLTIAFLLMEAAGFPQKFRAAFGQKESSGRFNRSKSEVQRYLGIKTLVSLATGGVVAAGMAIVGVDFPLLWGLLAFLANYIPTLGSIIAAVPPILLAIVQLGTGHAIAVALIFLATNLVFGTLLEPTLLGRRLGISTLVVFISLVFWGWVWGPIGMLLSVPLTIVLKIMLENTEDFRWLAVLLSASPQPERAIEGPKTG